MTCLRAQIQRMLADAVAFADFSGARCVEERRLPMGLHGWTWRWSDGDSAFWLHCRRCLASTATTPVGLTLRLATTMVRPTVRMLSVLRAGGDGPGP